MQHLKEYFFLFFKKNLICHLLNQHLSIICHFYIFLLGPVMNIVKSYSTEIWMLPKIPLTCLIKVNIHCATTNRNNSIINLFLFFFFLLYLKQK